MDLKLSGKTALVTGSTAGIGFAIAKSLAGEGAHVYVNGRTQARVDGAVKAILAHAPRVKVSGIVADFSGAAGADEVIAKLPTVEVLVNNVGIFEPKPFAEIPDADWYRLFEINVMSGVRLSRHYLAGMLKKNWGRIIFISSESGVQIPVEMVHYGMTKTAQVAIAQGVRVGGGNRRYGQQRARGADGIGGRGCVCGNAGKTAEQDESGVRERILSTPGRRHC